MLPRKVLGMIRMTRVDLFSRSRDYTTLLSDHTVHLTLLLELHLLGVLG